VCLCVSESEGERETWREKETQDFVERLKRLIRESLMRERRIREIII